MTDPSSSAACPTPCDADCDAGCHEWHKPTWRRDHVAGSCERGLVCPTCKGSGKVAAHAD